MNPGLIKNLIEPGVDLLVFLLVDCNHVPLVIENHKTSAGGSLVNGEDE